MPGQKSDVSQCIAGIGASIGDVDESARAVASSIDEQRRAISDIAESIAGIAERTERIASRMRGDASAFDDERERMTSAT